MSGGADGTNQNLAFPVQIPELFFNSFSNSFTASEITSLVSHGSRPLVHFIMTPSVAKTFAIALAETVAQYEKATGEQVLTIHDLNERIAKSRSMNAP